jgi:hypothetical protein
VVKTVFFSWQSDTPVREGKNLVETALREAIADIGGDSTLEGAHRELEFDKDTQGMPGSPPIVDTIFRKIDQSTIYVADLTFVATRLDGRKSPNPNVLMEYGWALKSRGTHRIISIANIAFGRPSAKNMPFNLRHIRFPIEYECYKGASDENVSAARSQLAKILAKALRAVLKESDSNSVESAKLFLPLSPVGSTGRFRRSSDPLGVVTDTFSRSRRKEVFLGKGPACWLRLMPRNSPGRSWLITEIEALASPQHGGKFLAPLTMRARSYDAIRAQDGYGTFAISHSNDIQTTSVTFVFTTGEVWGLDTELLVLASRDTRSIPDMREIFSVALANYADLMQRMGVTSPYRWQAGMEDLKDRTLHFPAPAGTSYVLPVQGHCLADCVVEDGDHVFGDPPANSLRPFFAKLYDLCGLPLPPSYGAT